MFGQIFKKETTPLDEAIARVLKDMTTVAPGSEEYSKLLRHLEQLSALKSENRTPKLSRDTILIAGGNLLGILIIVAYEQKHVITSKALPFLPKK